MDCGKERERAMLPEMHREGKSSGSHRSSTHLLPLATEKDLEHCGSASGFPGSSSRAREALWLQQWHHRAGLGKAGGCWFLLWHVLNGQGVGNWMGHKRGTQRGPPRSQKGETVPEEQPLPGLFSR